MRLLKAHGLGNDYLVVEQGDALTAGAVRALCDRHRGPGGDGVLEPVRSSAADYGVRIWNPDGSTAEKSGNGLRIFAYWLHHVGGAPPAFRVDTGHEVVSCEVAGLHVEIEMGSVTFLDHPAPGSVTVQGERLDLTALRVGNPHAVIWTDAPDLDVLPWRRWGAVLEPDRDRFPDRTNVQVARTLGPGRCEARIWERGAGETLASGSSACAVVAVAVRRGAQPAGTPVTVEMPGGHLQVTVREDRSVRLAGPVQPVARIELLPAWLATLG